MTARLESASTGRAFLRKFKLRSGWIPGSPLAYIDNSTTPYVYFDDSGSIREGNAPCSWGLVGEAPCLESSNELDLISIGVIGLASTALDFGGGPDFSTFHSAFGELSSTSPGGGPFLAQKAISFGAGVLAGACLWVLLGAKPLGTESSIANFWSTIQPIDRTRCDAIAVQTTRVLKSANKERRIMLEGLIALIPSELILPYVDIAVGTFVSSREPDRLDDAVDFLSALGSRFITFAMDRLISSPPNGANDDYWYVIVRALGRMGLLSMIKGFASSPHRTVREAVVEALADVGDKTSLMLLREFATSDESSFIRNLAQESLSEID
jgi:hypothetical protein